MKDKRILVLSRDPGLISSLKDNLPERGYQVIYAEIFDEGLRESLEAVHPDIVLVDTVAPSLDGIELSLKVRQMSSAPILMLSNSRTRKDRIRRLDLGAKGGLSEPISFTDLMRRIEEATS